MVLRIICWVLEHICLGLEAVSEYLRGDYVPERPTDSKQPRVQAVKVPVEPTRPLRIRREQPEPISDDVRQMMIQLGDKKATDPKIRAQAEELLSRATRVPINP